MDHKLTFGALLLASCATFTNGDEQAIRSVMTGQEAAWDRGNIDAFMAGYADTACFISSRGRTCGKDRVTANYLEAYPDKAAMGDLAFSNEEVLPIGPHHAWMTGSWTLHRTTDTLSGGFSLLWVEQAQGWLIARDHSY